VKLIESWDNPRFTQMQANRAKPNVDVAVFIDVLLPLITRSGLIEKLDAAAIPNLANVDPAVRGWNDFAVPMTYGSWGILYNAARISKPIESWGDLLRDDLKGHVSHPNITYNSSVYSLDALARLKGGSLRQPDAGMQAIRQIRLSGPGLWEQESIAVGWIKTEEIWATPYFSGTVLALMEEKDVPQLKFAVPREGAYYVPMNVTKVTNGPNAAGANAFIDHMLAAGPQEAWTKIGRSRPVNQKVAVPKDVADSVPLVGDLRKVDWDYYAQERGNILNQWNATVNR
jgi:putative spermidine/putrescine transport system substrate-binding protein